MIINTVVLNNNNELSLLFYLTLYIACHASPLKKETIVQIISTPHTNVV